ncbi:MAG: PilZ domain-containing protein [Deltaproteobacteria bacterium]|nr:PilZ domain-containing protein [Deltaproteobacteria bacterium]
MQETTDKRGNVERRESRRYIVKDVAFAVLKNDSDEELGQIINIGTGGLAFQYFIGNRDVKLARQLDLLLADNGLHIDNLPFQVVADYELKNELPFSSIKKRQQSVCFTNLHDDHKDRLAEFIHHHTYCE